MDKVLSSSAALTRLQRLCSMQEKCISDVRKKLKSWNISSTDSEKIIASLLKDKFIDENRYTRFFVRDKYQINKWGKEKIRYNLMVKGIDSELIRSALDELGNEDDESILSHLLLKKLKTIRSQNTYELKGKLIRYGTQRGFAFDIVNKVVDEIVKD